MVHPCRNLPNNYSDLCFNKLKKLGALTRRTCYEWQLSVVVAMMAQGSLKMLLVCW